MICAMAALRTAYLTGMSARRQLFRGATLEPLLRGASGRHRGEFEGIRQHLLEVRKRRMTTMLVLMTAGLVQKAV